MKPTDAWVTLSPEGRITEITTDLGELDDPRPVVVLSREDYDILTGADSAYLFHAIARIREVTGVGHGPMIEDLPAAIASKMRNAGLDANKAGPTRKERDE